MSKKRKTVDQRAADFAASRWPVSADARITPDGEDMRTMIRCGFYNGWMAAKSHEYAKRRKEARRA